MAKSNKLKGLIVEHGLTQGEVAKNIGIDKTTLSRKINNSTPFTVEEAKKIAKLLEMSAEQATEIFFG
ncbi:phage repressor [Streptococcus equi subsp. equi]|uniref:helix-turn-helix transcriptional regulator n=1 Tax=Streptococcus equi TaxID=1336 RepID=UPI000657E1B1|nr:phage repressor [Streptococcus equi subsp. equi]